MDFLCGRGVMFRSLDIAIVNHRLRRSIPVGETEIEQLAPGSFNTPCCANATKPIMRVFDSLLMDQFAKPEQVYRPGRASESIVVVTPVARQSASRSDNRRD